MPAALLPIELLLDELGDVLLDDELLLGDVLLPEVLPVALVSPVLLPDVLPAPVVPDVEPDIPEELDEPIMAFVRV